MEIYQIDAFTREIFKGNPAAVVPLESWIDSRTMQKIAAENNLSETAFFCKQKDGSFEIRWFTPQTEVNLCGHATLAAAHVIFTRQDHQKQDVLFHSKGGDLKVTLLDDGQYLMDFPSKPPKTIPVPKLLPDALGVIPLYTGVNTDLLVLVHNEQMVRQMKPDLLLLKQMEVRGVIITAASDDENIDFVSRFFAPSVGIPEDPVTGSAHSLLIPFWSKRLDKSTLNAAQVSKRGGLLLCVNRDSRVEIGGYARTYMKGEIEL